jgi:hypothetical protein
MICRAGCGAAQIILRKWGWQAMRRGGSDGVIAVEQNAGLHRLL